LALLLDYDGTLTEIDPVPVHSILDKEVRDLLVDLSKHPNIKMAIISGRILNGLKEKVS
jgi:trehalose-phosphatase